MSFYIVDCQNSREEHEAIACLLIKAFIEEGHTDRANAVQLTSPEELRKRGEIILARSTASRDQILGLAILVEPRSSARQVAMPDEAEIHLLAVDPIARGQGIGLRLVAACEQKALALGYKKIVLSTQPAMKAAHHIYERLGYQRNPARDWTRPGGRFYLVYEKFL